MDTTESGSARTKEFMKGLVFEEGWWVKSGDDASGALRHWRR
jgi:hypothetical protein